MKSKKIIIFFTILLLLIIISLSSCFKSAPVELLNTDHVDVSLGNNYDFYSKVNASAVEIEFDKNIPKEAFMYDKNSALMMVKNYPNKTVVMYSKARKDITKGEKLFSVKREYLNPESNKIETKAAILDEKTNKIITKAVAPYEDGLSVSDSVRLRSGDEASIVIHAKSISGVESFQIDLHYPNELIDIDTSKGNNGVELLNSAANNTLLSDPINTPGKLEITFVTQDGSTISVEDEDIVRVYIIAKDVNPKGQGNTTLEATLLDSNLDEVTADTHAGEIVVYDPELLGDFDDPDTAGNDKDNTVDMDDFLVFLDHYGTAQGDALYDEDFDIYPAEIAPLEGWEDDSIYSIAFHDGKVDLYDFIIFARNYGKSLPSENTPPLFGGAAPVPADGALNVSITTSLDFDDATDPDGDSLTYDVYLSTDQSLVDSKDPSVKIASDLAVSQTSALSLERGTTYYWKAVAKDGKGGEAETSTYSFSTETLDKIFVAGGNEGVFVIDVSDTSNPQIEKDGDDEYNIIDTDGYAYDVAKFNSGNNTYIAIADGEKGIKVALYDDNNSHPQIKADLDEEPFYLGDMAKGVAYYFKNNNHYILATAGSKGLYIINFDPGNTDDSAAGVSDNPVGQFTLTLKSHLAISGDSNQVTVDGTAAYVAAGSGGLVIVDISDLSNPEIIGTLSDITNARDVAIDGDYAYVAGGETGVYKVDVSDKTNPSVVSSYNTSGYAESVDVQGDYVYVADGANGVVKLEKSSLSYVGSYNTGGYAKGIVVDGGTGFVGDGFRGLEIINVNDMTFIGNFDIGLYARDITLAYNTSGNAEYVIVADSIAGVKIYDAGDKLSNIDKMTLIKSIETEGTAKDVVYVFFKKTDFGGNEEKDFVIYVADGSGGIVVINADVNGNDIPFENGDDIEVTDIIHDHAYGNVEDILAVDFSTDAGGGFNYSGDEYIYAANGENGLDVYSIGDSYKIFHPEFIIEKKDNNQYSYNIGNMMYVELMDDYDGSTPGDQKALVIADGEGGVVLYDLSDPENPTIPDFNHARYDLGGSVYGVYTKDNFIYVANGERGISVIQYNTNNPQKWEKRGGSRSCKYFISNLMERGGDYFRVDAGNGGILIMKISTPEEIGDEDFRQFSESEDNDSDGNYVVQIAKTEGMSYLSYNAFIQVQECRWVFSFGWGWPWWRLVCSDEGKYLTFVSNGFGGIDIYEDDDTEPYEMTLYKHMNWVNFNKIAAN